MGERWREKESVIEYERERKKREKERLVVPSIEHRIGRTSYYIGRLIILEIGCSNFIHKYTEQFVQFYAGHSFALCDQSSKQILFHIYYDDAYIMLEQQQLVYFKAGFETRGLKLVV